jgi:hypothetical protein
VKRLQPSKPLSVQEKWEERLKREGLGATLPSGNPYRSGTVGHNATTWRAKAEYFVILSRHLHDTMFPDGIDRAIMTYRAEGYNFREIHKKLYVRNNRNGYPRTLKQVRYTVRHYENLWGAKKWTDKERGL